MIGKTRRVYKFYSKKWGIDALKKQRLKISTLDDLNDPFEFAAVSYADERLRGPLQRTRKQVFRERGLICFSKSWSNPVLWSHYADGHRGLCLGIDVPSQYVCDVNYVPQRIEPSLSLENVERIKTELFQKDLIRTKYAHWKYEDEARIFHALDADCEENGMFFADFAEANMTISEVIIGAHYTSVDKDLHDEIRKKGTRIITSRLAFQSFEVIPQKAKSRQKKL